MANNKIGKTFKNLESYNKEMSKAMEDKLFFVEKLPHDKQYIFVDFGCADGVMIKNLINIFGENHHYIGYDCSTEMINLAKKNYDLEYQNVKFTSDWSDIEKIIKTKSNNSYETVIILSSVIHEVYSYAKEENDINIFWNRILKSGFNYIVIRDMIANKSMDRLALSTDIQKIKDRESCAKQLKDFESIYGPITNQKNLIHFLLKYRWIINWERELHENYFPIYLEDLLGIFEKSRYKIKYIKNFKIHFWENKFFEDFSINLLDNTHIKLILKSI